MTAVTETPADASAPTHDTWPGLLRAEWTKIRSVRSTVWSLIAFMIVAIGFSLILAFVISNVWNQPGNHPNQVSLRTDPTSVIYGPAWASGSSRCVCSA